MEDRRREMVRVAREILNGRIGIVAGARQMTGLRFPSKLEKDEAMLVFVGIDSESDHLPLGDVRRHWDEEVLKTKDEELRRFELSMKEQAFRACENLIAKYDRPN
ncbi:MAG TPA: hypothetical protein VN048_19540 [Verrucomicrobiae bacterium]|nr:hypothetical protein [Verrucomicrobiae bacterium]